MPWQLSYSATTESDSAELQTDVMRFMAILAFCLVAVFAIVRSLPAIPVAEAQQQQQAAAVDVVKPAVQQQFELSSEPVETVTTTAETVPVSDSASPAAAESAVMSLHRAPRATSATRRPEAVVLQRASPRKPVQKPSRAAARPDSGSVAAGHSPTTQFASATKTVADSVPPVAHKSPQPGLSLRFESDAVLRSLVARGMVDLYAIDGRNFYAMTVDGPRVQFVTRGAPAQYHEMVSTTVPDDVAGSFRRRAGTAAPVWGVTLPAATTQQLMRFVRTNFSGGLVITADAGLALAGS